MQVGIGRGGFYSYDVLDNPGRSSSDEVLGEWQHLGVGDTVAPMVEHTNEDQAFRIAEIDEPTTVVWTKADSSWAWVLRPVEGGVGRTRLITRLKVRYQAAPSTLIAVPMIEIGDFAMMRRMLLNIRARATRLASGNSPPA